MLEGNLAEVRDHLNNGAKIKQLTRQNEGVAAVSLAFIASQFEIMKFLIEQGGLIAIDAFFIMQYVGKGPDDEDVIHALLKNGISPNGHVILDMLTDDITLTDLISDDDMATYRHQHQGGVPRYLSLTLLSSAIDAAHINQVRALLRLQVNVNAHVIDSYLRLASNSSEITRLLLAAGAELSHTDLVDMIHRVYNIFAGSSQLTKEEKAELANTISYHLMYGTDFAFPLSCEQKMKADGIFSYIKSSFERAAARSDVAQVKNILTSRNYTDGELERALAFAAGRRNLEAFELLLSHGARRDMAFEVVSGILRRPSYSDPIRRTPQSDLLRTAYLQIRERLRNWDRRDMALPRIFGREDSYLNRLPRDLLMQLIMRYIYGQATPPERYIHNHNLLNAIEIGDESTLKAELETDADPCSINRNGTPIWQILLDSLLSNTVISKIMTLLAQYGWTADQRNAENQPLLTYIANNQELLERRAAVIQRFICALALHK